MAALDLSDEQKQLRDQVRRMLAEHATPARLRAVVEADAGFDADLWRQIADMGLPGAAIPERHGGAGLGAKELCLIAEELGRVVAPIPFFSSICLAAEAIKLAGTRAQQDAWLPKLASGEANGAFAWTEGPGPAGPAVATRFTDGRISGQKSPVADAELAHVAVVVCAGPRLALVDLSADGVRREPLKGFDQLRKHARLSFDGAPAELMAADAGEVLLRLYDRAAVFEAFEQVGAAEAAMLMARDYTLQRYTFGRPLASYQAVKHNLANILVMVELARSNALHAATMLDGESSDLAAAAAATARLAATRAYEIAARENLQLHGGIGFTWEADCHFHYRRARLLALNLGSPEVWEERLIDELTRQDAAA